MTFIYVYIKRFETVNDCDGILIIIVPYPPLCSSGPEINWAFTMPFSSHMWAQRQQSRYWPLICLGLPRFGVATEGMEGMEGEEFFRITRNFFDLYCHDKSEMLVDVEIEYPGSCYDFWMNFVSNSWPWSWLCSEPTPVQLLQHSII